MRENCDFCGIYCGSNTCQKCDESMDEKISKED